MSLVDRVLLGTRALWLAHDLGLIRIDPRPEEAEPRAAPSILTVVLRLDATTTAALSGLASELAEIDARQYAYPSESIHVTLVDAAGLDPERVVSDIRRAVAPLRGSGGRITGFALSPATAFAALAVERPLREMRLGLRAAWDRPAPSGAARLIRADLWHATVVRLTAPPSTDFVRRLRHLSQDPATRVTFRSVDVVRTNKVMAASRTTTLASFEVG